MATFAKISPVGLHVVEVNPRTDLRWESFVAEHPNGTIYQHPAWLTALEREYGQKGVYFACEDGAGRILAILPMLYTRGLPFSLGGAPFRRRLSSLPRTPIAGPLSIDLRATAAVLQEAVLWVSKKPGVQLQIKTQGPELEGLVNGIVCTPWRLSYVLNLMDGLEKPFQIGRSSRGRTTIRWAIKKATALGVHVRAAETEAELLEWYSIYVRTMRRNLVPPRPYRFFAAIWDLMRPRGMMQLLLAEQERNGRKKILAGSIFLMFGRTVSYAFNGASPEDFSLRPNDVIQWHAISEAHERGFHYFDFGEVVEGDADMARFKSKWGSEPVRLRRYYYPAPGNVENGVAKHGASRNWLFQAVWRRLPLTATTWLGDHIYARL